MTTFRLHLKMIKKPNQPRIRFDLQKLKDPKVKETFQAMIGGKFAPLITLDSQDTDLESITTTFNTALTSTNSEIISKYH